ATLYMLATGKTLLEGNSPTETVAAIARGDFPSVLDRRPNLPSGLARIITRALAITPEDRYPDVASLGAALAELAGVPAPKADDIPRVPADLIPARAHPDKPGPGPPSDVAAFAATGVATPQPPTVEGRPPSLPTTVRGKHRAAEADTAPPDRLEPSLPAIQGRFQLIRKLGSGSLGEMWLAQDTQRGDASVALKIFRPARGASIDAFKAEFRELSVAKHPNLVRIRDFGLIDDRLSGGAHAFYTMDYVDGPTLGHVARDANLETIYGLLVQLARGLIFLHAQTHRPHLSLKPQNIFLARDAEGRAQVVLTDPGNPTEKLRNIHRGERTSLPYAAPETLAGLIAGRRADLYSFGVIAFELLAGRRPFVERTPELLRSAHLYKQPPDLRLLRPEVPPEIAAVIEALLVKDPAKRPPAADVWIRAVNQVVVPPYPIETEATHLGRFSSAPWIGRLDVLETMVEALHHAGTPGSRRPRVLLVTGAAGVGKGRLLTELRRTAQLEGAVVYEGRPGSRDARPFAPLLPIIHARGAQYAPGLELGEVAAQLVGGITRPSVMMLRNVERMDRSTLEVLAHVSRILTPMSELDDVEPPPVLVVLTVRDGALADHSRSILEKMQGVTAIDIPPLDLTETADMLQAFFGTQPLSDDALKSLHRVTLGNPADVQDVLYTLLESGDLLLDHGVWSLRPGVDVPLPKSVGEATRKRFEMLSLAERDVLEALCVFGGPVTANIVDSLGPRAAEAVSALVERELLVRRLVDDEVCLTFVHERVREALLRDVSPEVLASRHRQAAVWLEQQYPDEQAVEALATHWREGGRPERALSFLLEAAKRTQIAGDIDRTIQWFSDALAVLPSAGLGVLRRLKTEATIREALGMATRSRGDLADAEAHFARHLAIGEDLEDPAQIGIAVDRLALVMIDAHRFEDAIQYAERGHDLALSHGDRSGQAMALRLIGSIKREMKGPGAGLEALNQALEVLGGEDGHADVQARIAVTLSYGYADAGQPEVAISWAEWGLEIARAERLVEMEVSLLINLSMAAFIGAMPERALSAAKEATAICRARGLKRYYTLALGNMGDSLRVLGDFDQAERLLREALRETYTGGNNALVVSRLIELTALALDRGMAQESLPYLREAWRLLPSVRTPQIATRVALSELRLRLCAEEVGLKACPKTTSELLREVTTRTRPFQDAARVRAMTLVATAAVAAGPDAARDAALEAARVASQLPAPGMQAHADAALSLVRVLRATGQAAQADVLQSAMRSAIEACAARIASESLRASYLAIKTHTYLLAPPPTH
ncbi:MAG: serine/threonine protein kinase/tetratricopeptide (TPR) repeat protein, partial [Myxococcota bacterium]